MDGSRIEASFGSSVQSESAVLLSGEGQSITPSGENEREPWKKLWQGSLREEFGGQGQEREERGEEGEAGDWRGHTSAGDCLLHFGEGDGHDPRYFCTTGQHAG